MVPKQELGNQRKGNQRNQRSHPHLPISLSPCLPVSLPPCLPAFQSPCGRMCQRRSPMTK